MWRTLGSRLRIKLVKRKKTQRKNPEHDLQKAFFEWLLLAYPWADDVTFAVPNGVRCSASQAAKLKAEGLKAGIPDVFMSVVTDKYPGLYIEFKIKPNKPSDIQEKKISSLKSQGYRCEIIYDLDAAIALVKEYLGTKYNVKLKAI